jgi:hypothetical protein
MPKYDTGPARMPAETQGNGVGLTTKGGNPPTTGATRYRAAGGIFWYIFCSILGD